MKHNTFSLLLLWIALVFSSCTASEPVPTEVDPTAAATGVPVVDELAIHSPIPPPAVSLDDFGPAPELNNEVWLNTDGPLRLADLRGQVVLIDMWTFG